MRIVKGPHCNETTEAARYRHLYMHIRTAHLFLHLVGCVKTSEPFIDGVDHALSLDSRVRDARDESHHGHSSVVKLCLRRNTHFVQRGHDASKLRVTLHLPLVHGVILVQKQSVREGKWGNRGKDSDHERVDIGDQDNGPLVRERALSTVRVVGNGGKGSPLLKVKGLVGIGDESVRLRVSTGAHNNPAEHSVASIPDFSLDRRTPSPLRELGVIRVEVSNGVVKHRACHSGSRSGVDASQGGRGKGTSRCDQARRDEDRGLHGWRE
mmetsp:Transcript_4601/g.10231  ORF Transcript_4601/g.10231 Transcript_4601/m.10231 type:complete len:267 (-) Transcript_4601:29-829(-)